MGEAAGGEESSLASPCPVQSRGVIWGEFVYAVWTAITIVIFQHSFDYIQSHYHWIIAEINVLQSKKCLYNICILDQIIQIFRITLSLSHCCWYFPTWSPKQFPVIWWSWIALGKTMNGNEWLERERGGLDEHKSPCCQSARQDTHNTNTIPLSHKLRLLHYNPIPWMHRFVYQNTQAG